MNGAPKGERNGNHRNRNFTRQAVAYGREVQAEVLRILRSKHADDD